MMDSLSVTVTPQRLFKHRLPIMILIFDDAAIVQAGHWTGKWFAEKWK